MSNGCCGPKDEQPECPDEISDPCACEKPTRKTYCDGDTKNNVWVEHIDPNASGICLLDTMTECQVIYSIEHDDVARADLLRVTTDPHLQELARTIPKLPTVEPADAIQSEVNRDKDSIPFYSIFRGQPPFAQ